MESKVASVDLAWYSKFSEKLMGKAEIAQKTGEGPGNQLQTRGFDYADAMETGVARSLTSLLVRPPSTSDEEQRLVVLRCPEQRTCSLMNDVGETLLMSRLTANGCRFDIFISHTGLPPLSSKSVHESEPAFALVASSSERKDWALMSQRCESCESKGKRRCGMGQVARLVHYIEPCGAGHAFCMDMRLPRRADGACTVVCEACGAREDDIRWPRELTSRRPKWNIKHKSLTMDFRGRATRASAKNFQLESPDGTNLFLFGKVDDEKFVLDYRSPLGMVQAFAAALSVSHWQ